VGAELHLRLKAMPNAPRSAIGTVKAGELLVRVHAQPDKGRANRELLELLAHSLGLPRSALRIVSGEASRHKVVALPLQAEAPLARIIGPPRGA
jgi:hypothetical protein